MERKPPGPRRGRPDDDVVKVHGYYTAVATLRARPEAVVRAYIEEAQKVAYGPVMRDLAAARVAYRVVPAGEMERVSGSHHHEGICLLVKPRERPSFETWLKNAPAAASVLVLDGVSNPHNLGAIVRTAAHFRVQGLWVVGQVAMHGALARVSEGGIEHLDVFETLNPVEVLRGLKRAGFALVGADQGADPSLFEHRFSRRTALVLGAERDGLSEPVRAELESSVSIPGSGAVESLNVSAATAVLLAEYARQRAAVKAAKPARS